MAAGSRVGRKQAEPGKVEVVRWIPAATAVPVRFHSAFTHASACVSDRRDRTAAPEYPKRLFFIPFVFRESGHDTGARHAHKCTHSTSLSHLCKFVELQRLLCFFSLFFNYTSIYTSLVGCAFRCPFWDSDHVGITNIPWLVFFRSSSLSMQKEIDRIGSMCHRIGWTSIRHMYMQSLWHTP